MEILRCLTEDGIVLSSFENKCENIFIGLEAFDGSNWLQEKKNKWCLPETKIITRGSVGYWKLKYGSKCISEK